jgi:hypothetical protein
MKINLLLENYGKQIIFHILFFALFLYLLLGINADFYPYYFEPARRSMTYLFLGMTCLFYVHNIALFPILLEEKKETKYLRYTLIALIAFVLFALFLALNSGKKLWFYGIAFYQFRSIKEGLALMIAFITLCFPIAIISFIYGLLVYGKNQLLPYWEVFIHVILLTTIYSFIYMMTPKTGSNELLGIGIIITTFYSSAFGLMPTLIKDPTNEKFIFYFALVCLVFYLSFLLIIGDISLYFQTAEDKVYLFLSLSGTLLITLFLSYLYAFNKIKDERFQLKIGSQRSELNLLKSQVNPHFLFNSLNALYGTALDEKATKTAQSVAKLANLIRYMQEDINKDFIPLKKEISYLKDYMLIQNLRCAVPPKIEMNFEGIDNQLISPGLLIPFVENAFKYGINPTEDSSLFVAVNCQENSIDFECINSYDDEFQPFYKEQGFGIGIQNARQRLKLVYPKSHRIEIKKEATFFSVKIRIDQLI